MQSKIIFKKSVAIILALSMLTISACKKKPSEQVARHAPVTLTYYKLYENEENLTPLFNSFIKKYPYVTINYKKFIDPEVYLDTIVSEIAEGGGPDIVSVPNTWIYPNLKKLQPAPSHIVDPQIFKDTFVDITASDNIFLNTEGDEDFEEVYGIPLSVDTLALYYNDSVYEQVVPERGKPASTWSGIQADVRRITAYGNPSTEINRSALALGVAANVARTVDVFYLLALQNDVKFYANNLKSAAFSTDSSISEALDLILSFGDPSNPNYTWNLSLADSESAEKEIVPFVRGQTSMIFGYSHLYKDLLTQINIQNSLGADTISPADIKIVPAPQLSNDINKKIAYANYFTEAVTRNSQNPEEAWLLLTTMIEKDNLEDYYKKDFKPTSRRDLIPTQRNNGIYSAFIEQLGYAKVLPIADQIKYKEIFTELMNAIVGKDQYRADLLNAQTQINKLIPNEGVNPQS